MNRNTTIRSLIAALFLCFFFIGCGPMSGRSQAVEMLPSPASGITLTSQHAIPIQGEYADDTAFFNIGFILDYQLVQGYIVANLTEVWTLCNRNYDGSLASVESRYSTTDASMNASSDGTVTLDANVSNTHVRAIGSYDSGTDVFTLTSSTIPISNSIQPVTLHFVRFPRNDALTILQSIYSKPSACVQPDATPTPIPTPTPTPLLIFHGTGNKQLHFTLNGPASPYFSCTDTQDDTITINEAGYPLGSSNTITCDSTPYKADLDESKGIYTVDIISTGTWTFVLYPSQ